jgi:hypothetical protein
MKPSELFTIIENTLTTEIKKTILEGLNKKNVYHIMMDGEPIATFDSEKKAEEALPDYKAKHKGELIIEKGEYDSHSDMIDKLDKMGEELEEKENKVMKNQEPTEGNAFTSELLKAKESGKEKFTVDGKEYDVKESWNELSEEELFEGDMDTKGKEDCLECGDMMEETGMCEECGGTIKEGMCEGCGKIDEPKEMNESKKKKTLRLTESQMLSMIEKMVKESVPGIEITKRSQNKSKSDNEGHAREVSAKLKKASTFENNDNPEFPKPIGKGTKIARQNTKEEDEYVSNNRGGGMEDLDYDIEPSENFKKRVKMSLEGDKLMGNSHDAANVIKSDTGKNLISKVEKRKKKIAGEDNVSWGHSWKEPQNVNQVNETEIKSSNLLNEEIEKMKRMANYDKKTQ